MHTNRPGRMVKYRLRLRNEGQRLRGSPRRRSPPRDLGGTSLCSRRVRGVPSSPVVAGTRTEGRCLLRLSPSTGQPKADKQVIADVLAHGTSYSELDTASWGD